MPRCICIVVAVAVVGPALAVSTALANSTGGAVRATGDFEISLDYTGLSSRPLPGTSEARGFTIQAKLGLVGSDGGPVRVTVTLPEGVVWGRRSPTTTSGCTVSGLQVVCLRDVAPPPGTNRAADFGIWDVVARETGTHTFEATVETPPTDVDASNNATTLTVRTAAAVGGVALRPARPTVGGTLVASHPVWMRSGNPASFERATPLGFGSVRCTAAIASAKVKAVGSLRSGSAVCTTRIPKDARGKVLRGTIETTSGGLVLTKTYSTRIG